VNSAPPLVAVVIPAFRASRFVGAAVKSVLAQTHARLRLVVVDDGSDDGTGDVAEAAAGDDPRVTILRRKNGGVATARNEGFAAADVDADYCAFLDADDVWTPDALTVLLAAAARRPDGVGAYGLATLVDAASAPMPDSAFLAAQRLRRRYEHGRVRALRNDEPSDFGAFLTGCNAFTPGVVLVRAPAFRSGGGFARAAEPTEDWDMWVRLTRNAGFEFADRIVLHHRRHDANVSCDEAAMRRSRLRLGVRWSTLPEFTDAERAAAAASGSANQRYLARVRATQAKEALATARIGESLMYLGRAADHFRRSLRP